jgi:hypothetical protein
MSVSSRATPRSAPSAQLRLRSGTARLVWPANDCPVVMVLLVERGAMHEAERIARSLAATPGILSLIAVCHHGHGLDGGTSSIEWIADHAAQLGADGQRLILAGVEGGAAMAAALTVRARDRGWPDVEHQVLIHPRLGAAVRETQLAGIAAATVIGGDHDSRAYVDGLRRAGVPVWQPDDADLPRHLTAVLRLAD